MFPARVEVSHPPLVDHIENEIERVSFQSMDAKYLDAIEDVVARTMIIRHKERKFGQGCVEDWRARNGELMARLVKLLKPSEKTLGESPFLFGGEPVYADYALLGVVENATYKGWNTLPDSLANLSRWRRALREFRFS